METLTRWWVRDKFSLQDKGPTYASIAFPDETIEVYKAVDVAPLLAELAKYKKIELDHNKDLIATTAERDALRTELAEWKQSKCHICLANKCDAVMCLRCFQETQNMIQELGAERDALRVEKIASDGKAQSAIKELNERNDDLYKAHEALRHIRIDNERLRK